MTDLQQEVYNLRAEGWLYAEIAQKLQRNRRHIKEICVHLGVAYSDEERERAIQLGREHLLTREGPKQAIPIRKCLFCGSEYRPVSGRQKYCSEKCRDHARCKHTRAELEQKAEERKVKAVAYYDSEMSVTEICKSLGIGPNFVYSAWRDAGLPRRLTKNQRQVLELRKEGRCSTEIADALGICVSNVSAIANNIGMPFTDEERQRSRQGNQYTKRTEMEKELYVNSFFNGDFSYVGGYKDCDSKVFIKCNTCGHTFERSMVSIRKKLRTVCPQCLERRKEQRERLKQEKQIKLSQEREQRRAEKERAQIAKTRTVACAECGKLFQTTRRNALCCSPECSKKRANRYCTHRKDKRIPKERRIDRGITAKRLYARDKGICWICGKECDLDDYIIREGNVICGDNYPSVDHIIPVCEGGADSWSNVKLAHRRCNLERYLKEHA